jgi:hypothetical protein
MRSKVTAVSYLHIGVIDTTVHVWCNWPCSTCHSSVIDTTVRCVAESDFLIKKMFKKTVGCTLLCNQLCLLSSRIQSHIWKDFDPCIRGPGDVVWWKKQRLKISCQGSLWEWWRLLNSKSHKVKIGSGNTVIIIFSIRFTLDLSNNFLWPHYAPSRPLYGHSQLWIFHGH